MMKYLLDDSLMLNTQQEADGLYHVTLSNGEHLIVGCNVLYNGQRWPWMVDGQIFSQETYAINYLRQRITEKLTGIRVVYHAKRNAPEICGVEGRACRAPGECNRALCSYCPVAEAFFAERDGVKLVYAI